VALAWLVTGCLSFDEPTPSPPPATPGPSPTATVGPRDADTLVVAIPAHPARLLPPGMDPVSEMLAGVLYDPLYRLDPSLQAVPELAAAMPDISPDGMAWSVSLKPGVTFQDGTSLTASDVVFSIRLARSPVCTLGRDLCDAVSSAVDSVEELAPDRVSFQLRKPWQPFLAEVLARVPIVSEDAVRAGTQTIVEAMGSAEPGAPDAQVARIAEATNADACLTTAPPFGCRLADHTADLEATLAGARLALPSREVYTDAAGTFDAEAYAGALLDRVAALGQVLTGRGTDPQAAALELLDPLAHPLGSGPFRLESVAPGERIELVANPAHVDGAPAIERITVLVIPDPSRAATLLQTGDVDWLPQVEPDQAPALETATGLRIGSRPVSIQRAIVFNVRPGRVYDDPRTRRAFGLCLDRAGIADEVTEGAAIVADSPSAAGSWAFPPRSPLPTDPAAAERLLDEAGWSAGPDGIRVRDGQRLSSEVLVRPSRVDLLTFAQTASAALKECGIELVVSELDLTGDRMLTQLQWPNDFETVLVTRALGVDPDHDMAAYEGVHATSEDNPADANPGGYQSEAADVLIASARTAPTQVERAADYAELRTLLDEDLPAWPIWYDTSRAAISDRVTGPDGPIDPIMPRYDWDVASWSLAPPSDP
jgi:ABC-type transport system substrate-binding protein